MAGRICFCGSNKTSFRVFLLLHVIFGVASFILSVVGMVKVQNWKTANILYEAESLKLKFDPKRAQSALDFAGVLSCVGVLLNLVNLLFLLCGFFGEVVKHTGWLTAWNVYLTTLLTFSIFGFALIFISGQVVLVLAIAPNIAFLSFSVVLTGIRRKESKMDEVAAARSGGEAGGFECNGEQAAVDGARVECPERRDLPSKYSDISRAEP